MALSLLPESKVAERRSPHWFDGVYAGRTNVLHHGSVVPLLSRRSMLDGLGGEGQTRYINDKSGKWLSLTSLAGVLGNYAEMKEMIL